MVDLSKPASNVLDFYSPTEGGIFVSIGKNLLMQVLNQNCYGPSNSFRECVGLSYKALT